MPCTEINITQHAFARALVRGISLEAAVEIARTGEVIATYPDDKPYPSRLVLGATVSPSGVQPLHVVVGESPDGVCTIITVYLPDPAIWEADFRTKRKTNKP